MSIYITTQYKLGIYVLSYYGLLWYLNINHLRITPVMVFTLCNEIVDKQKLP